jgi:O-6-methylguanine DNA methyltransferase
MDNKNKAIFLKMKRYPLFYQKVWKAAMEIKKGEVKSYKWIARKIGKPKSARAVALALKRNPFAPIVPCHRVIKSNGEIGGYSAKGGVKKKIELLKKESKKIKILKNKKTFKIQNFL